MYKPNEQSDGLLKATKVSQAAERDELQRRLGSVLVLKQIEGVVRSPVITLSTEKTCIYNVVEKHLKPEAVVGTDRWWRLCRSLYQPQLEAWRPRVNGTQLKALQGVRLPESDAEWGAVRETLDGVASWLKVESSPELFLSELKELAAYAHDWWENRTKREGSAGPSKRVGPGGGGLPSKRHASGQGLSGDLQGNHPLLQELAAAATGGAGFPRAHQVLTRAGAAVHASNGIHVGPGGEPLPGYMDLMTSEQSAQAALPNGYASTSLTNGPVSDPGSSHQVSRLGPRFSAVTLMNGEVRHTEVVPLNIGGRLLTTELSTLTAIPDTPLSQLATAWQSFPHQQIFLDRSPQAFEDLLDQMRAVRSSEENGSLPRETERLEALQREATYFSLPAIAERAGAALMDALDAQPVPSGRQKGPWQYDFVYVESGFSAFPDAAMQEAIASAQADIEGRAAEGWEVVSATGGAHARQTESGADQRNLHCNFVLRRGKSGPQASLDRKLD